MTLRPALAVLALTCAAWSAQAATAATAAAPASAQAAAQQLVPAQSSVQFIAKQMGVPMQGYFKKFSAQLRFDPSRPEVGAITFTVETGSATIGDPATDKNMLSADWFNVAKFPQAKFVSESIKPLGSGRYQVTGTLTIRDQTERVSLPVQFTQSGAVTTATGALEVKRLDFQVGGGDWSDTNLVADEVTVKFSLALTGVGKLQ